MIFDHKHLENIQRYWVSKKVNLLNRQALNWNLGNIECMFS